MSSEAIAKPVKERQPIENFTRIIALTICVSVAGVWVALNAAAIVIVSAGGDATPMQSFIADMQNLLLLVVGAAIAAAFNQSQGVAKKENIKLCDNCTKEIN